MMRRWMLLLTVCVCGMGQATAPDWVAIVKPTSKQVLRLEILRQGQDTPTRCTAVVINEEQGYLLTANHCVDKQAQESLSITANGRHADLLRANSLLDLAVLKTQLRGEKQIAFADKTPEPGTPVAIAGFAWGDPDVSFQFGYVAQTLNSATKLVFLNTDVIGGNSGGPCINARGELVAINSRLYIFYSSGHAASVPIETIKEFVQVYLPRVVK